MISFKEKIKNKIYISKFFKKKETSTKEVLKRAGKPPAG
jgi:hypothetical protein